MSCPPPRVILASQAWGWWCWCKGGPERRAVVCNGLRKPASGRFYLWKCQVVMKMLLMRVGSDVPRPLLLFLCSLPFLLFSSLIYLTDFSSFIFLLFCLFLLTVLLFSTFFSYFLFCRFMLIFFSISSVFSSLILLFLPLPGNIPLDLPLCFIPRLLIPSFSVFLSTHFFSFVLMGSLLLSSIFKSFFSAYLSFSCFRFSLHLP